MVGKPPAGDGDQPLGQPSLVEVAGRMKGFFGSPREEFQHVNWGLCPPLPYPGRWEQDGGKGNHYQEGVWARNMLEPVKESLKKEAGTYSSKCMWDGEGKAVPMMRSSWEPATIFRTYHKK